jgi:hypothetical protein
MGRPEIFVWIWVTLLNALGNTWSTDLGSGKLTGSPGRGRQEEWRAGHQNYNCSPAKKIR